MPPEGVVNESRSKYQVMYTDRMGLGRAPLVAVMAISSVQPGCSFLFVEGPPPPGEKPFRALDGSACTERNKYPVTDFVVAASIAGGATMMVLAAGTATPPPTQTAAQHNEEATRIGVMYGTSR